MKSRQGIKCALRNLKETYNGLARFQDHHRLIAMDVVKKEIERNEQSVIEERPRP